MKIVGMVGSLRRQSIHRALLEEARARIGGVDAAVELGVVGLEGVPLFDQDVEAEGIPEGVAALRAEIERADGVLIATPEYNHGVPGVLKNAIDWLSRPPRPHPFDGKPVGVAGATPGAFGTRAAQYQLRQSLTALNALVMPQPQLLIRGAGSVFDDEGKLIDSGTAEHLERFLAALVAWVERLRSSERRDS